MKVLSALFLLEHPVCSKRFLILPQHAALSTLISYRLLISRPSAGVMQTKTLFTLSNYFDNRGIWPPTALSLTFAIAKSLARFTILALSLVVLIA